MDCSSLLVLFSLFFATSFAVIVNYVDTPSCATSAGGCNFISANWSSIPTNGDAIIINSNEDITLYFDNSQYSFAYLYFGNILSGPVNIIVRESILNIGDNETIYHVMGGNTSSLIIEVQSEVYVTGNVTVQNISIFNSTIEVGSILNTVNFNSNGANISSGYYLAITNIGYANYSSFSHQFFSAENLYVYYSTGIANLNINTYLSVFESTWQDAVSINLVGTSAIAEFHETLLNITNIQMSSGSLLSFHSSDSSKSLTIDSISNGAQIHLGDNVNAAFHYGSISNITLGANPNVFFGGGQKKGFSTFIVKNIQNFISGISANITVITNTQFSSNVPLNATINSGASSIILRNFILAPGNIIQGDTELILGLGVDCFGSLISVSSVYMDNTTVVIGTLETNDFNVMNIDNFYSLSIAGNLVTKDLVLGRNTLNISGDFNQNSGTLNVALVDTMDPKSPRISVGGSAVLNNVEVAIDASYAKKSEKYLVIQGKFLNTTNLNVTSGVATSIQTTTTPGELYVTIPACKDCDNTKSYWQKHKIVIISCVSVFSTLLVLALIIFVVKHRRHHHYESV